MSEIYKCPTCNHESKSYLQRLNKGSVDSLINFRRAVGHHNRNDIHLYRDMDGTDFELTAAQKMNWTKLRFFGLVAKVKENGEHKRGYWLLTARGAAFLRGELAVPKRVKTLNNRKIDESEETVTIKDIMKDKEIPYFDDLYDIVSEPQALFVQMGLLS